MFAVVYYVYTICLPIYTIGYPVYYVWKWFCNLDE